MISAVMNMHYFAICNLQSDNYNGHMRACLSYQCCSNTDLLVIIIIFVSVKLTSQKILEGEKRSNLHLKKNVKFNRELDTAKVNCRNPNSTEASIIYSGCKYWFSCHQNKYCQAQLSPSFSPSWQLQPKLAELSLILHFTDHPPTPTPPCQ